MSDPYANAATGTLRLAKVLESHYEELHRFAQRKAASASMADDVMQDAWLRLAGGDGKPMDDETIRHPLPYLYRIVANLVVDRQRQSVVRLEHERAQALPDDTPSHYPSPFQVVAGQQEYAILQQAVRELPERCREVFLLYRAQNMSMREIAARLGLSPKTVENHLARAMLHCRQRLRDAGRGL